MRVVVAVAVALFAALATASGVDVAAADRCIERLLEQRLDEEAFAVAAGACVGADRAKIAPLEGIGRIPSAAAAERNAAFGSGPAHDAAGDSDGDGVPDVDDACAGGRDAAFRGTPEQRNVRADTAGVPVVFFSDAVTYFYYVVIGFSVLGDLWRGKYTSAAWSLMLVNVALLAIWSVLGPPKHVNGHAVNLVRMTLFRVVLVARSWRRATLMAPPWSWSDVLLDVLRTSLLYDALAGQMVRTATPALPLVDWRLVSVAFNMLAAVATAFDLVAMARWARGDADA